MNVDALQPQVLALGQALRGRGWKLATAESCTGGLIAAACTSVAGSSDWFERGVVSYSNEAKTQLLGVPPALIERCGAVSEEVARAMAAGVLAQAAVQLSVAVTGIAGPGGGSPDKPVGTVWLAWAMKAGEGDAELGARRLQLQGDRSAVRQQTVEQAFACLQALLGPRR